MAFGRLGQAASGVPALWRGVSDGGGKTVSGTARRRAREWKARRWRILQEFPNTERLTRERPAKMRQFGRRVARHIEDLTLAILLRGKVTWHSGDSVKRRRVCRRCGEAFPTAEVRL